MKNRIRTILFLLILLPSIIFAQDGFGENANGGKGGTNITVTSATEFITYATSSLPYIITVSGTININGNVNITSNKTIEGLDSNATINGDLMINGSNNIIIQYLNITNPIDDGSDDEGDGITIINSAKRIFVDHCTFFDCADGMCDISNQSDSVTVSWCRFYYVNQTAHRYVNLVGSNDKTPDLGYLHVTFHHCWYNQLCNDRMPSVRFGRVHVYNNYFSSDSALYCVRTRLYAECLVENNYFKNVQNPWELGLSKAAGTITGKLSAQNNNISFMDTTDGVTWKDSSYEDGAIIARLIPGTDTVFLPPYTYKLDDAENVKSIVLAGAGNNKNNPSNVNRPNEMITGFHLFNNCPNPFNPSTMISYQLPVNGKVNLEIFNSLGQKIETLVDEFQNAGFHSALFALGSKLSSGIYFYRLKAGNFSKVKRMILLK